MQWAAFGLQLKLRLAGVMAGRPPRSGRRWTAMAPWRLAGFPCADVPYKAERGNRVVNTPRGLV